MFSTVNRTPVGAPGTIVGDGKVADYLAESGFIPSLVACDGSFNLSQFCDPEIDARMRKAARLATIDPQQSHELWSEIEHDLVDRAPWVPLINIQS